MKTNKNDDFFNYFIRGLDSKAQAPWMDFSDLFIPFLSGTSNILLRG